MTDFHESSDGPLDVGVYPIFIRTCFLAVIHNTIMAIVCPELVGATAELDDVPWVLTFCLAPDLQKIRKFF
jgi:hypothetical protein